MIADCVNSAHSGRAISFKRGDFCAKASAHAGSLREGRIARLAHRSWAVLGRFAFSFSHELS
jgi:hypothetical protein